jgi:hypothetical protein
MVAALPTYQGWTVDVRLREFRKVRQDGLHFLPFNTTEGDDLLGRFINAIDTNTTEGHDLLLTILGVL